MTQVAQSLQRRRPGRQVRRSHPQQLPQPPLHPLLIRLPRTLKPRLDLAPLDLVCGSGSFHRHSEPGCGSRGTRCETTSPEFIDSQHRRFIKRAGRDLNAVPDALAVGEGNDAGACGGHQDSIAPGRRKGEYIDLASETFRGIRCQSNHEGRRCFSHSQQS